MFQRVIFHQGAARCHGHAEGLRYLGLSGARRVAHRRPVAQERRKRGGEREGVPALQRLPVHFGSGEPKRRQIR